MRLVRMRLRFALAAALPALASGAVMALLADRLARRALEDELGARLVTVAQAAASALPADRLARLAPGDEETRTYGHVLNRLETLARHTETRLVVVRPDGTALADSAGHARIGEPVAALMRDRVEIAQAAQGKSLPSAVLFEGSDGRLHRTGYAPVVDETGAVVAVVGADGAAAAFARLRRFQRLLATVAIAGAVLGAVIAALAALEITRPLLRLSHAARRIARGDLETPLWRRKRRDEIRLLRDTMEEMRQSLRARDEERELLLAGIAHEIRNPLGGLDLFTGLLAEELEDRPEAAHVVRIRAELGTLSRVVEEFLDFARAKPLELEPVSLAALAEEVAELLRPLAVERSIRLRLEASGTVMADREKLRRALLNLGRNAVEASPAGEEVQLVAFPEGRGAVFEVRDRGPGLGPARAQLFRPFYTTKEKGTGLGLALVKKVAEVHGGSIALLDREAGGTIARLTVPGATER
jgi:signal transduction histidine kinase